MLLFALLLSCKTPDRSSAIFRTWVIPSCEVVFLSETFLASTLMLSANFPSLRQAIFADFIREEAAISFALVGFGKALA